MDTVNEVLELMAKAARNQGEDHFARIGEGENEVVVMYRAVYNENVEAAYDKGYDSGYYAGYDIGRLI